MAQILELKRYRKHPVRHRPGERVDAGPLYYCQRCDTDHFKLAPTGEVHCAHCGALMRNIQVTVENLAV